MGRGLVEEANIRFSRIHGEKHTVGLYVLGATLVLTDEDPDILDIDANGAARNVTLPAITAYNTGRVYYVCNLTAATYAITLKQSDGSTTLLAVAATKHAIVWNNGTTWRALAGA